MTACEEIAQLKYQLECYQREVDRLKGKLCEAECRADNAHGEAKRLHHDAQARYNNQEKAIHTLQASLSCKDEEICYKAQVINQLERQVTEARQQREEVCKVCRAKDSANQECMCEVQKLRCEIKKYQENECCLQENFKKLKCNYDQVCCQLKSLQDPCNVKKAVCFIEKMMSDKGDVCFCNRNANEVTNFLKQEIGCMQQVFACKQEEGLVKVAQLLVANVFLEKEECDSQALIEQKDKQICCLQQEVNRLGCEHAQLMKECQCAIQKLECEIKSRTMAYQQLEQAFDCQNRKLCELEKLLQEEKCRCEQICCEKRHREAELMGKIEELQRRCHCLEEDVRNKTYALQKLEQALEQAECHLQECQMCLQQEKRAREDCCRRLQELQCQYATKEKQVCELERCLEQAYEQCQALTQQIEEMCRMEACLDRIITKFMSSTNSLAANCGRCGSPCASRCSSECPKYDEFERRLELATCLAKSAADDKAMCECLKQELLKKDQQIGEMICCMQQTQAKLQEREQQIAELQMQVKDACCQLGCITSQLEQEKINSAQLEKMVRELECQLKDMNQLKTTVDCLKKKLDMCERDLACEQGNNSCCKEAMMEMQRNCRTMSDDLKAKEDCCNMLQLQVKRQECEIKSLTDQIRALQGCGPCRPCRC